MLGGCFPSLCHFIFKLGITVLPGLSSRVEDSINTYCCIPGSPLPCPSAQGQKGEVGWRRVPVKGGLKLSLEVIMSYFQISYLPSCDRMEKQSLMFKNGTLLILKLSRHEIYQNRQPHSICSINNGGMAAGGQTMSKTKLAFCLDLC